MADKDRDFNAEPTPAEDDGSLKVDDYQAPGIHIDAQGKQHTLPPGAVNYVENDPLHVPNLARRNAEGFYQYFEKIQDVPLAISKGFRPVTRKQAGFVTVEGLPTEYGLDAGDVPHRVHDLVLLEAPMHVYKAIDKERQRVARSAIAPILKTANKVELDDTTTGNKVEDFREASITGTRIRDIQQTE